ncbi:MAG: pyruvate kinase [Chloroflexi bacterium]|nr:pyruvate kinase [Chloroflexota bacterium]
MENPAEAPADYLKRKTKIVCTLGPASASRAMLERLLAAGMNVVRLNLSHGTEEEHRRSVETVRDLAARRGLAVAVMMDLPGPKHRTGDLADPKPVRLKKGGQILITTRPALSGENLLFVNFPGLPQAVTVGEEILVSDGQIRLQVLSAAESSILCRVVAGGMLRPGQGLSVPGAELESPTQDPRLHEYLDFAISQKVDFLAVSFVSTAQDILQVKEYLSGKSCAIPLIAKIERRTALLNLEEILAASDGLMVARGDLGLALPLEQVPLIQKDLISRSNRLGKPVITATQMLESMVQSIVPTRAEVADIANAVIDGSDAVMLSEETAIGHHPAQAVAMMSRVALEAESILPFHRPPSAPAQETSVNEAISYDACHTSHQVGAVAIVVFTESGASALWVSKYRPRVPIVALTPSEAVCRRLALSWGVHPWVVERPNTVDELFVVGASKAEEMGLARSGNSVVIVAGVPVGVAGTTNLLKVERVG